MTPKNRFWIFAGLSILATNLILLGAVVMFLRDLTSEESAVLIQIISNHAGYLFVGVILIIAAQGLVLDAIFHNYIIPLSKIADETVLINSVNPSHRIKVEGGGDIKQLVQAINDGADRYEDLFRNVRQKINRARAEADNEKNIMAVFMSELPQGVLICNAEGRILLYNRRAGDFLSGSGDWSETEPGGREKLVGLGRSIFDVVDRNLIRHALNEIDEKLKQNETDIVSLFVIAGHDKTIRVETVPILDQARRFKGFLLILFDITNELESENRVGFILQELIRDIRSSIAGVRSAVEAILEYPEMEERRRKCFNEIIHKETLSLSETVNRVAGEYYDHFKTQWPLTPMPDYGLLQMIARRIREKLEIAVDIDSAEETRWVKVDSYSMTMAVLFLLNELKKETGAAHFSCTILPAGRFVNFDFSWRGDPVKTDALRKWKSKMIMIRNEGLPLSIRDVAGHHSAEIWCFVSRESGLPCVRLSLPVSESETTGIRRNITILPQSKMEFYDFDLFDQPGRISELDDSLLTDLTYTVFDTETTGLDPKTDEIIAIGAVRIVNGNLLRNEIFDHLVDPRRDVPIDSIRIHGVKPDMLEGKPTIDKVLPLFHQFAEGTVMVAHNAAFDMRMLEEKEAETGIRFINPVLDTLLLAAVVHSVHERHDIETLAERLGINVTARHTALGDAISTGETLLKLIPLLAAKGIGTLKEARAASRKTLYAKLKY